MSELTNGQLPSSFQMNALWGSSTGCSALGVNQEQRSGLGPQWPAAIPEYLRESYFIPDSPLLAET